MSLRAFVTRHRMLLSALGGGSRTAIRTLPAGTAIYIKESGAAQEFTVIAHDYPSAGNTLLMRAASAGQIPMGDAAVSLSVKSYAGSNVDTWLQNTFLPRFSAPVREMIQTVAIGSHEITGMPQVLQPAAIERKVFILSATEITGQANNAEGTKIPYFTSPASLPSANVWTRQVAQTDWADEYHADMYLFRMYGENYNGAENAAINTSNPNFHVLPCFCLPSNASVDRNSHLIVPHTIFGFHIDSSITNAANAVTYLEDAVGMTPAHMDFANDTFDYGDWENAFFMPRPCMLRYNGTVDYYLNPDDYSKKEDGTASDAADSAYAGNAMMEWGRRGKKIWYKIVPDAEPTSASVYIADYQADPNYHAWSFINNQGLLADHFYTPIYNGSIDGSGRLRSIGGIAGTDLCSNKTPAQEAAAAELNNPGADKLWYTEVYADITLINLLLVLMGKSLDTQAVFGYGHSVTSGGSLSKCLTTGAMDAKGLFWGQNKISEGVKVFGMEHWWGNLWRRFAGLTVIQDTYKYKLTYGTQDGSEQEGYVSSETRNDYLDYISGPTIQAALTGTLSKQIYNGSAGFPFAVDNNQGSNYCDHININRNASRGSYFTRGGGINLYASYAFGAFCMNTPDTASSQWQTGAALSCKPLA